MPAPAAVAPAAPNCGISSFGWPGTASVGETAGTWGAWPRFMGTVLIPGNSSPLGSGIGASWAWLGTAVVVSGGGAVGCCGAGGSASVYGIFSLPTLPGAVPVSVDAAASVVGAVVVVG